MQGQVTLSTSAPMAEGDLLAVLETVLRANGATLVESSPGTYRIMPVDAAIGRSEVLPLGGRPVQVRPGYGITIVPLRNISSTSAAQFIQPLVASPEDIRIDPGRNAILFSGTGVERQNVVETLADLDVDWMAGKSIGLFPLQRANAEAIIPELQAIFAPVRPDRRRALADPLPAAGPAERGAGDRRRPRADARGRALGRRGSTAARPSAPSSTSTTSSTRAAEDVAKLLNEAFSERPGSAAPARASAAASAGAGRRPPAARARTARRCAAGRFGASRPAGAPPKRRPPPAPVKVVASKANNSLLIRATPADYESIEATLARLDTAPWQVLIEATIAEVTLNDSLRYGVQYFLQSGSFAVGFNSLAHSRRHSCLSPIDCRASTSCSRPAAATSPSTRCRG